MPTVSSIPPQDGGDPFIPPKPRSRFITYNPHTDSGYSRSDTDTGISRKIVCTMMNDSYGFGSFRNRIWLKHSAGLPKEYEVGYHTIFLPLVAYAKRPGITNKFVKQVLEHIARHRTRDIRQEMRGKSHITGRIYRKILEPICYFVGKIRVSSTTNKQINKHKEY